METFHETQRCLIQQEHHKNENLCSEWIANLWIISKLCELHIIKQTPSRFNDVLTLLGGFFHFASQEKTTSPSHLYRETKLLNTTKFRVCYMLQQQKHLNTDTVFTQSLLFFSLLAQQNTFSTFENFFLESHQNYKARFFLFF